MKKKVLTTVFACLMGVTLMLAAGCGGSKPAANNNAAPAQPAAEQKAESPMLDKIEKAGKIVMATDAAWAPFEYIGADGEVTGSDIELGRYIADALGVELEILNASFDTLSTYIDSGDADMIIAAMTITEERQQTLDFSMPYTVASQYIIVPQEDDKVACVEDMAGYRIGTHLGTTGDFLVCDAIDLPDGVLHDTGATYAQYKSLPDATVEMKNGKIDAIVCDVLLAENLCALNPELKCFELVYKDGSKTDEEYGIAVKKGDPLFVEAINSVIEPLLADGTLAADIVRHTELAAEL